MPTPLQATLEALSGMQALGQGNANIERTIAATMAIKQDTEVQRQQIDLNNQFMSAVRARQNAPDKQNPDTTPISDADTDGGKNPEKVILSDLNKQKRSLQGEYTLAQQYGRDTKPYLTAIGHLDTEIAKVSKDAADRVDKRAQQTANVLRDVDSTASLNESLKMINDNFGKKAAMDVYSKLPHDSEGMPIWNDSAKSVLAPYVSQFTTMHEKAMQGQKAAELKIHEDANKERIRHDKATEQERNSEIAVRREGIAAANKRHENTLKAAGLKYDSTLVKQTQADLNKLATDAKIGDFKALNDMASSIETRLLDPAKGYASVTPEDARAFVEQSKLAMKNFRSSMGSGSKLSEQEFSKMNSLLERAEKWVDTFGKGESILAKDQMLNMTETAKTMYQNRNAELVKQELQRKKILSDRGNNPDWVIGRGDIDALKESGRAAEVTIDNKKYLAIVPPGKTRKDLKKEDLFEIPQAPKMPTFLETGTGE
jgi:hypothetical protein